MTLATMLLFLLAYATAVAVPGPGLAALIARVLARGTAGVAPFIAGFIVGDLVWFAIAAAGMAALAESLGALFIVIRFAGAAYLLYVAYKLVTARPDPVDLSTQAPPGGGAWRAFATSLALALGNPKVILFFMALLPTVLDLSTLTLTTGLELAFLICVVQAALLAGYTLAAARARRLFTSRKAMRALNIATGTVITGAAVAVATR